MSGFKLLAITPLAGCNSKFRKNLEIGEHYKFYNNYEISISEHNESILTVFKKKTDKLDELYSLKNGIKVNISAVVGKNGSGKSTLFELFYYLVYKIVIDKQNLPNRIKSYSQELYDKSKELESDFKSLGELIGYSNLKVNQKYSINYDKLTELGYKTVAALLIMLINKHELNVNIQLSETDLKSTEQVWNEIGFQIGFTDLLAHKEKQKEDLIRQELNLSVLFENNLVIFEIMYFNGQFSFSEFSKFNGVKENISNSIEEFDISEFFYSISINYSHHSLNSVTIGNWISQLFHKNDAYITPLVINPMRDNGNFNINHELELSKERLMSNVIFNILNNNDYKLLGKYKITKFIFTPKYLKPSLNNYQREFVSGNTLDDLIIKKLEIFKIEKYTDYWDFALVYLDTKLNRINHNYSFLINKNNNSRDPLLDFVLKDNSHVTKKVRQTLNFLKSTLIEKNSIIWTMPEGNEKIELSAEIYIEWLKSFNINLRDSRPLDIIDYIIPGFFSIDFELKKDFGDPIKFGDLSSGEQQMILNNNSLLYHLYNLQSVHIKSNDNSESRINYKNINIILDEIELYYHPEMQRQLVKSILDSFENIKSQNELGIESINICFSTHSPFILSDIPKENVLQLREENNKYISKQETFAANIHELLADSFFLQDSFIGDFAKNKIQDLIIYLNFQENIDISDNNPMPNEEWSEDKAQSIINIIGEPIIKERLQFLFDKKTSKSNEIEILNRIERLNQELKIIRNKR